jgi:hypothetical protein
MAFTPPVHGSRGQQIRGGGQAVVPSIIPLTLPAGAAIPFAVLAVLTVGTPVAMGAVPDVADAFLTVPRFNSALLVRVAAEAGVGPQVPTRVAGRAGRIVGR